MSKPIYMSIHDMEWHETAQAVKTMPIARRPEPDRMDDELRRLCLAMVAVLKRRYPNDWRRMVAELERQAA